MHCQTIRNANPAKFYYGSAQCCIALYLRHPCDRSVVCNSTSQQAALTFTRLHVYCTQVDMLWTHHNAAHPLVHNVTMAAIISQSWLLIIHNHEYKLHWAYHIVPPVLSIPSLNIHPLKHMQPPTMLSSKFAERDKPTLLKLKCTNPPTPTHTHARPSTHTHARPSTHTHTRPSTHTHIVHYHIVLALSGGVRNMY